MELKITLKLLTQDGNKNEGKNALMLALSNTTKMLPV